MFEDCSQTKRATALAGLGLPGVTSGCPQGIFSDTLPTLWKRAILHTQAPWLKVAFGRSEAEEETGVCSIQKVVIIPPSISLWKQEKALLIFQTWLLSDSTFPSEHEPIGPAGLVFMAVFLS